MERSKHFKKISEILSLLNHQDKDDQFNILEGGISF